MKAIKKTFAPLTFFIAAIWVVEAMNFFFGRGFTSLGIFPRQADGLIGIPLAPLLHANFWHAASNTLPLLILGGLVLIGGRKRFWTITIGIVLLGGFLVWILGRSALHVGASGLIFGYFGALLTLAYLQRSLLSTAIACVTMFLYGGMLWGILPLRSYISFEGHLFGLVAGAVMAWVSHRYQSSSQSP